MEIHNFKALSRSEQLLFLQQRIEDNQDFESKINMEIQEKENYLERAILTIENFYSHFLFHSQNTAEFQETIFKYQDILANAEGKQCIIILFKFKK